MLFMEILGSRSGQASRTGGYATETCLLRKSEAAVPWSQSLRGWRPASRPAQVRKVWLGEVGGLYSYSCGSIAQKTRQRCIRQCRLC
jgi:hypothetical protein